MYIKKQLSSGLEINTIAGLRTVLCHPGVPSEAHKVGGPHKQFTPSIWQSLFFFKSLQTVKTTSKFKGGLNNKVFIITPTRAT